MGNLSPEESVDPATSQKGAQVNPKRPPGITAVIGLSILVGNASLAAQQEVRVCCTPNLVFGGAEGTPVSITHQMDVTEDVVIGELHVVVKISHTWVGNIDLDLISPMGTTVRLHDGAGGDSDDLDVVYSDSGVPNGAELFDFGCYMQVSGDGGVGALAEYAGQSSPVEFARPRKRATGFSKRNKWR